MAWVRMAGSGSGNIEVGVAVSKPTAGLTTNTFTATKSGKYSFMFAINSWITSGTGTLTVKKGDTVLATFTRTATSRVTSEDILEVTLSTGDEITFTNTGGANLGYVVYYAV